MSNKADDLAQHYINFPEKQKKLYKHTLIVVSISQIFGGAGLGAGIAVGALLARQMLGTDAYAGVPAALFTFGSAVAAFVIGRLSQRYGRRKGLTTGFMVGGLGAIGVVIAAIINSISLLFISLLIYGAGTATNLQARYAGTDLASKNQRGTAISIAMVSVTLGAFVGPNLIDVMGNVALAIGIPKLAGPFILSGTAFILAGFFIFLFLRPDPYLIVKAIEAEKNNADQETYLGTDPENNNRGIVIGTIIMVITQMVMLAIMTMTPVHMEHHGHGLGEIGLVIGVHIASMYLPSLVTGILVDKIGRTAMVIASGVTLLLAGVLAAIAPPESLMLLLLALALLGVGWNFGLISGTALIVDSTQSSTRAKTQGTVDVFIAIAGAAGGAMSGIIVAGFSYAALSFAGGFLSLLLIPLMLWFRTNSQRRELAIQTVEVKKTI